MEKNSRYPEPMVGVPARQLLNDPDVTKYGWMRKKSNQEKFKLTPLSNYDKRFVIILKGWVYYYKDENSESPQKHFSLNGYSNRRMIVMQTIKSLLQFLFYLLKHNHEHQQVGLRDSGESGKNIMQEVLDEYVLNKAITEFVKKQTDKPIKKPHIRTENPKKEIAQIKVTPAEEETNSSLPHVFKLYTYAKEGRTYYFAPETKQLMNEWKECFKSEIDKYSMKATEKNLRPSASWPEKKSNLFPHHEDDRSHSVTHRPARDASKNSLESSQGTSTASLLSDTSVLDDSIPGYEDYEGPSSPDDFRHNYDTIDEEPRHEKRLPPVPVILPSMLQNPLKPSFSFPNSPPPLPPPVAEEETEEYEMPIPQFTLQSRDKPLPPLPAQDNVDNAPAPPMRPPYTFRSSVADSLTTDMPENYIDFNDDPQVNNGLEVDEATYDETLEDPMHSNPNHRPPHPIPGHPKPPQNNLVSPIGHHLSSMSNQPKTSPPTHKPQGFQVKLTDLRSQLKATSLTQPVNNSVPVRPFSPTAALKPKLHSPKGKPTPLAVGAKPVASPTNKPNIGAKPKLALSPQSPSSTAASTFPSTTTRPHSASVPNAYPSDKNVPSSRPLWSPATPNPKTLKFSPPLMPPLSSSKTLISVKPKASMPPLSKPHSKTVGANSSHFNETERRPPFVHKSCAAAPFSESENMSSSVQQKAKMLGARIPPKPSTGGRHTSCSPTKVGENSFLKSTTGGGYIPPKPSIGDRNIPPKPPTGGRHIPPKPITKGGNLPPKPSTGGRYNFPKPATAEKPSLPIKPNYR